MYGVLMVFIILEHTVVFILSPHEIVSYDLILFFFTKQEGKSPTDYMYQKKKG